MVLLPDLLDELLLAVRYLQVALLKLGVHFLVKQDVGILRLIVIPVRELIDFDAAPEALRLEVRQVELGHPLVVELEPLVLRVDDREVVPGLSAAAVHEDAGELVVVVLGVRPAVEAHLQGELEVIVHLHLQHGVEVELEPLKRDDEHWRELLEVAPFDDADFLAVLLAVVLVLTLENVALDEEVERVLEVVFVLDLDGDGEEGLLGLPLVIVALLEGDDLVPELAPHDLLQDLGVRGALEVLLQFVGQDIEEFIDILLDEYIDRLVIEALL